MKTKRTGLGASLWAKSITKKPLKRQKLDIECLEARLVPTISGRVFEDFYANGAYDTTGTIANLGFGNIQNAVDRDLANIQVTTTSSDGVVTNGLTGSNGVYSINPGGVGPFRVQFQSSSFPAGFRSGPVGADSGSTVQFVNDGAVNVSLGLLNPDDFSQVNPLLVSQTYVFGGLAGPNAASPVIVNYAYNSGASDNHISNTAASNSALIVDYLNSETHTLSVNHSQVGSTWGLGFNKKANKVYAASYLKKHTAIGPTGTGAIYVMNETGNAPVGTIDLNSIVGGNVAGQTIFRGPDATHDYDFDGGNIGWDAVGKVSLGGLDVNEAGNRVFVMNLNDRRLYAVSVDPTTGLYTGTNYSVGLPDASTVGGTGSGVGDLRPFAVQVWRGKIYIGVVNSAESTVNPLDPSNQASGDRNALRAYVFEVTDNGGSMTLNSTPLVNIPLNYERGYAELPSLNAPVTANWNPWSPTYRNLFASNDVDGFKNGVYAQPMLTGLAFDEQGNLNLGFRDRAGDQYGRGTLDDPSLGTNPRGLVLRYSGISAGDTLRAFINTPNNPSAGFTLENNLGPGDIANPNGNPPLAYRGQGPGGSEFFFQDNSPGFFTGGTGFNDANDPLRIWFANHDETSYGGVLQIAGYRQLALTSMNPARMYSDPDNLSRTVFNSGGIRWFNVDNTTGANTAGTNNKGYMLYTEGTGAVPSGGQPGNSFAKANGVGDLVALIDEAPCEIGNRIWFDSDNDGIQDANEAGIAGLSVQLLDGGNNVISTVTTDSFGRYIFSSDNSRPDSANADYGVAGVKGSNLKVRVAIPGGNQVSPAGAGTDASIDSNASAVSGFALVNVGAQNGPGSFDHTNDIGFADAPRTGTICALYFMDANGDGQSVGDMPLQGLNVTLVDSNNNPVQTLQTGADGMVNFTNIPAGSYKLTFANPPAGKVFTRANIGDDATDSDANPLTGMTDFFTLDAGGEVCADAGVLAESSICGFVYVDNNNNGVKENGEAPIGNITITLTGTDDLGNSINRTTTTAVADGLYCFLNLRPGTYKLTEGATPNFLDGKDTIGTPGGNTTNDMFDTINLGAGVNGVNNNFGEILASSICGFVYHDADNDGIKDAGEAAIPGITITLNGTDDLGNNIVTTAFTDGTGLYCFLNLRPGTYKLTEGAVPNYLDGKDTAGTPIGSTVTNDMISNIILPSNFNGVNNNFGEILPSQICGYVYVDNNNNGLRQAGEAAISGVTITLTGTDDAGNTINTTQVTDAAGRYCFTNLRPGTYKLTESQPAAFLDGKDTIGTPGGTTTDDMFSNIVLGSNVVGDNNNFGELVPSTLKGTAYIDENRNGIFDAQDTRLPGVVIRLSGKDDKGNTVLLTQTTDAQGNYCFTNLRPADANCYTLRRTIYPATILLSKNKAGSVGGTVISNGIGDITKINIKQGGINATDYLFSWVRPGKRNFIVRR